MNPANSVAMAVHVQLAELEEWAEMLGRYPELPPDQMSDLGRIQARMRDLREQLALI